MPDKVIDYIFDSLTVANPDQTHPATISQCSIVAGPGDTTLGTYANALDFSKGGTVTAALDPTQLNTVKFALRCVFNISSPVIISRMNLAESDCLPFALYADRTTGGGDYKIIASVAPAASGWSSASTEFSYSLSLNTWYTADLVYDTDTLGVFIDGKLYSVHAFPAGTINNLTGTHLYLGYSPVTTSQFNGQMAAVQLYNDIPVELEAQLDEFRTHPEWYITYKFESVKTAIGLGNPVGGYTFDYASAAYIQNYTSGLIMYGEINGCAFEMHGAIWHHFISSTTKTALGYLVSDETSAAQAGSRKSLFSKGGIYWSSATGALSVLGQMYVDYEQLGESGYIGLPVSESTSVASGVQQIFQSGHMYMKSDAHRAFEVHGAILTKYLATGAVDAWGFPVSNESDILKGTTSIGRISEFEKCSIYWSGASGAHEVHGDIRDKYRNLSGPLSPLGFPLSDEANIPNIQAPARFNSFQNGSILWYGGANRTFACTPFDIFIDTIDTKLSEGPLMGQNDVYFYLSIDRNGQKLIDKQRYPSSGDSDNENVLTVQKQFPINPNGIVPSDPNMIITFTLDVWDSDPGSDDHLGNFVKVLNVGNAWGLADNADGEFQTGPISYINSITWAVQPRINEKNLLPKNKWWGVRNDHTDKISYEQYADAFQDVDGIYEWYDPVDWLQKIFYDLAIEGVAAHGNCFGMSLSSIYSKKHRSAFSYPLDRFTDWNTVVNEFNIKHEYQMGAPALWWYVSQFLSGKLSDPKSVFINSRIAFNTGCDPVLCLAQHYNFTGAPHTILAIGWDDSVKPWKLSVYDPNFPSDPTNNVDPQRTILIDPDHNTFTYIGNDTYTGSSSGGGRLSYVPFHLLDSRPTTPIAEAIALLLSGTLIFLGGDAQTTSLTDGNGTDLDAFGADAVAKLQAGQSVADKFVQVHGFHQAVSINPGHGVKVGGVVKKPIPFPLQPLVNPPELHMHCETTVSQTLPIKSLTLRDLIATRADVKAAVEKAPAAFIAANQNRLVSYLANDAAFQASAGKEASDIINLPAPAASVMNNNFIHKIEGVNSGSILYAVKHKQNQFVVNGALAAGDTGTITVTDLGTAAAIVNINSTTAKNVQLVITNKMGASGDYLKLTIDDVPLQPNVEMKINIKPGLGGIEMTAAGVQIIARVTCEASLNKRLMSGVFQLNETGGFKIYPSIFITSNQLKVSGIDGIFGNTLTSKVVAPLNIR